MDIKVGDPTKKGIGATGHIVYTVTTRVCFFEFFKKINVCSLTCCFCVHQHLVRGGEISVLRRFSDFLWLFGTLQSNNPGVIVPPVPDKHPFGSFFDLCCLDPPFLKTLTFFFSFPHRSIRRRVCGDEAERFGEMHPEDCEPSGVAGRWGSENLFAK